MYDDDEGGMPPLPTVEECQRFMEAINAGRSAISLPTLAAINYDEADPGNPQACLSATYLFNAEVDDTGRRLDGWVGSAYVTGLESSVLDRLEQALDAPSTAINALKIPSAIKVVTDYFDECDSSPEWQALRDRFDEAGLLDA